MKINGEVNYGDGVLYISVDECLDLVRYKDIERERIQLSWDELNDILTLVRAAGWESFHNG